MLDALIYFPVGEEFTLHLPSIYSDLPYTVALFVDNVKITDTECQTCMMTLKQTGEDDF